jgi:hypothetical protein
MKEQFMAQNAHLQFTFIRSFSRKLRFSLFLMALLATALLLPGAIVHAQGAPAVSYNPAINTIFVGSNLSAGVAAGSQVISLQNLATALSAAGATDVLVNQGNGIWLSHARIEIKASARLEVIKNEVLTELRLESVIGKLAYIKFRMVAIYSSMGSRSPPGIQ